jgi:alanine racemase
MPARPPRTMAARAAAGRRDLLANLKAMDGHSEAIVDLAAIRSNVAALAEHVGNAEVMAVVKSDAYGHGLMPTAAAALAGGATWLGVGHVEEALALRAAGFTAPVLALLASPDAPHREAIEAGVDLSAGTASLIRLIGAAAGASGLAARVHLKADTGMSRGGAPMAQWPELLDAALAEQAAGRCEIIGVCSHLACADIPGHPSLDAQIAAFRDALGQAERAGARPTVRHLANTPALLTRPDSWFDLVRPGGGVTGLSTSPGGPPGWLRPAMTVRTHLVQVKRVVQGTGVSYGHRYVTGAETTLGLVPLGYNEGIPRSGTNTAPILVRGQRMTIAGTVCMNQCVVDAGDIPVEAGDEVVLFGPGDQGEPTAQEWADLLGTVSYDIVTRFTGKIPRSYCGVTKTEVAEAAVAGAGVTAVPLAAAQARDASDHAAVARARGQEV